MYYCGRSYYVLSSPFAHHINLWCLYLVMLLHTSTPTCSIAYTTLLLTSIKLLDTHTHQTQLLCYVLWIMLHATLHYTFWYICIFHTFIGISWQRQYHLHVHMHTLQIYFLHVKHSIYDLPAWYYHPRFWILCGRPLRAWVWYWN